MKLKFQKLHHDAVIPKYATPGSACFDIVATAVNGYKNIPITCTAGRPVVCQTGLSFEVPEGHVMLVFSRSGHGFKQDIRLANCVGVIDSDYRGELLVKLTSDEPNDCKPPFVFKAGDRVAQAMILPIPAVELVEVEELSDTERGTGGFGSTGK